MPVHELGLGHDGQVYFTMRLVKGDDLRVIYERVQSGADGWNPTRALGVLLKVCEAMAYAHDKGVEEELRAPAERLAFARTSVRSPESARLWSEAIAAIASSPRYSGLRLTPQLGLVPIGPDPASGLWEFAHLASGEPAQRDPDGKLTLLPESGLVLVLLPGGRVPVLDSEDQWQDAELTRIDLDPFFFSKYEMTIGQWDQIGG